MAYDRDSFLAGVSVGRNMKSWPVLTTGGNGLFALTIRVEESASFPCSFPIGARYLDGTIKWGDGTTEHVVINTQGTKSHQYAQPGIYQIVIVGKMVSLVLAQVAGGYWYPNVTIVSLDTPVPPIPPDWPETRVMTPKLATQGLSSIPDGFLDSFTSTPGKYADGLSYVFNGAWRLQAIPDGFFKNVKFSGWFTAERMFADCGSLRYIPDDLFDFEGVEGLTSLREAFYTYQGGVRLTHQLSGDFLSKCTGLRSVNSAFRTGVFPEGIPLNLFDHCPNMTDFYGAFAGINLPQEAWNKPVPDLWNQFPNAVGTNCFSGWDMASNYADIPASWGGPT